jgi:hypothetical protein
MRPGVSRLRLVQMRRLLVALALPLVATACGVASDHDARAYNGCLMRHAQDPLVCDGSLEAYRVTPPTLPARAVVAASPAVAATKGDRL